MGIDEKLTQEIVRRIVGVAAPDRIILYGSAATGEMTRDSDIDLLVLEEAPRNTREETLRIREALRALDYPFDVFVMATQRFEETKDVIGSMAFAPNTYGKVIYTKPGLRLAKKPEGGADLAPTRPAKEVKREVLEQWIAKAESNLGAARHLLSEAFPYPDPIGLHARFAAEQYLKAFLVSHQIEFTKINDLGKLLDLMATADPDLAESLRDATALNRYEVDSVPSDDRREMTTEDAEDAVVLATKVRDAVRSTLELD